MKFKPGLSKRRIRYATALFQKHPEMPMSEVSRIVKKHYGSGMAGRLLALCQRAASAEGNAQRQRDPAKAVKTRKETKPQHRKSMWTTEVKGPKGETKPISVQIDWRVAKSDAPKAKDMPSEFFEGLKLIRTALQGSNQSGTITLINYDERMEVKYELQVKTGKRGQFEVRD